MAISTLVSRLIKWTPNTSPDFITLYDEDNLLAGFLYPNLEFRNFIDNVYTKLHPLDLPIDIDEWMCTKTIYIQFGDGLYRYITHDKQWAFSQ